MELLQELLDKMKECAFLSDNAKVSEVQLTWLRHSQKALERLSRRGRAAGRLRCVDLTEFGSVVHAEMGVICDAARLGGSLKGAALHVAIFPCHNCTNHILAASIKCAVYIQPYPKSRARQLHKDEIDIEKISEGKFPFCRFCAFLPLDIAISFNGVSKNEMVRLCLA